jgi:hypothetical protein
LYLLRLELVHEAAAVGHEVVAVARVQGSGDPASGSKAATRTSRKLLASLGVVERRRVTSGGVAGIMAP